jgi:hypothetical protein
MTPRYLEALKDLDAALQSMRRNCPTRSRHGADLYLKIDEANNIVDRVRQGLLQPNEMRRLRYMIASARSVPQPPVPPSRPSPKLADFHRALRNATDLLGYLLEGFPTG